MTFHEPKPAINSTYQEPPAIAPVLLLARRRNLRFPSLIFNRFREFIDKFPGFGEADRCAPALSTSPVYSPTAAVAAENLL